MKYYYRLWDEKGNELESGTVSPDELYTNIFIACKRGYTMNFSKVKDE